MSAALLTVALMIAAGWPFAPSRDVLGRAGLSFLFGAGLVFCVLLVESLLRVPWSLAALVLPLFAVAIAAGVARRSNLGTSWPRLHWLDVVPLVLLAGYVRFSIIAPTPEYDFIGIWGVKAKEFWLAGGIDWTWLANPFNEFAHVDYPLLLPFVFDAQTLITGVWPDRWLGLVSAGLGIAALFVLRSFLDDEIATPWLSAAATTALAWSVLSPWTGLAEGAIVAFGTAGLLCIRRGDTVRGAVLLGFAASSKNEGLALIVAALLALLLSGRARDTWRLWPAIAITAPWLVLRSSHHLRTDLTTGPVAERIVRQITNVPEMFRAMQTYWIGKPIFWIAVLAAIVLGVRRLSRERFLASAIVFQVLFFIAAYLVTPHDVTWQVRWSWERIFTQLACAIGFLAVLSIAPLIERGGSTLDAGHDEDRA